jgi:tetratricopeptide (TPR) repeat protein
MENRPDSEQAQQDPPGASSGRSETHPQAADYLRSERRMAPGALLPVAVFALLAAVTAIAFVVKGPATRPSGSGAVAAPASGGGPSQMPVSMSYEEQLATLEAAVAADPRDTLALAALAELTMASHQVERALGLIDDWLRIAPESPNALLQKVIAYSSMQRWDEAIEANLLLYELDPDRLLTRVNMGALYANKGEPDSARSWWNGVVSDAPGTNEALASERAIAQLDTQMAAPRL